MIYKILKQNDLYHNPDPLFWLVGEANESTMMVEGQEARALLDSGSQLSAISLEWVKKLNLKPQQLQSILQIEGSGGWMCLIWVMWKLTLRYLKLKLLTLMFFN